MNSMYNYTCHKKTKILIIFISDPIDFNIREHIRNTYKNIKCDKKYVILFIKGM